MRFDYDEAEARQVISGDVAVNDAYLIKASIGHGAGAFTEAWTLADARAHLVELSLVLSVATADTASPPAAPSYDKYTFPDGTDPEWVETWATKMKATPSYREPDGYDDTLTFYYRDVPVLSASPYAFHLAHYQLPRDERMELWDTLWGKANQVSEAVS